MFSFWPIVSMTQSSFLCIKYKHYLSYFHVFPTLQPLQLAVAHLAVKRPSAQRCTSDCGGCWRSRNRIGEAAVVVVVVIVDANAAAVVSLL